MDNGIIYRYRKHFLRLEILEEEQVWRKKERAYFELHRVLTASEKSKYIEELVNIWMCSSEI